MREPVRCGIRKIHAVNVRLHEPSNSVEWPQLLKHLKKRPSGTRHDFVLVSSKSAGLRWSLGPPLKLRTRFSYRRIVEKGANGAAFSDFLPDIFRSLLSTSSSDKAKQGKNVCFPTSLTFSPPRENSIHLGQTRFFPYIY